MYHFPDFRNCLFEEFKIQFQNEEVDADGVAKKVRKKKNAGATIEKNINNINLSKFDLEFDVDPLFKKTSAQFDSGGGGGKFLCNLLTRDDSCQLLLDSNAVQVKKIQHFTFLKK